MYIYCGEFFDPSPRHKNQPACKKEKCQKEKKAAWQRHKMRIDPDLGREEDARGAATELLRIKPNFSLEREKDQAYIWFLQHKADKELVDIALNKARLK